MLVVCGKRITTKTEVPISASGATRRQDHTGQVPELLAKKLNLLEEAKPRTQQQDTKYSVEVYATEAPSQEERLVRLPLLPPEGATLIPAPGVEMHDCFSPGPYVEIWGKGKFVKGTTGSKHRWPASALGSLAVDAHTLEKRHTWVLVRGAKSIWSAPMVGIAPANLNQKLSNNQSQPNGGWYVYLGDCTLSTGGPPLVKKAPCGFPQTTVPEGGQVSIELNLEERTISFTIHDLRIVCYKNIDTRVPLKLSLLLSLGSHMHLLSYRSE